jgi:hypothetical protein
VLQQFDGRLPKDALHHFEMTTPYLIPRHREHVREGLQRAGLPNVS